MSRVGFLVAIGGMLVGLGAPGVTDEVGTVTYVEGYPELVRDAKPIYEDLDLGFRVENFDAISTDSRSAVEITFDETTGIDATLTVEPYTDFSLELTSLRSEQTGTVELLAGSVSVTARALTGTSRFQIRTPAAVMGVRGTVFSVTDAPGGEFLVSTDEGLVEVTNPDGRTLFAVPGEAVEIDEESTLFRNVRYDRAQVAAFRAGWREERLERFIENAPRVLSFHGRAYLRARDEFIDAYGRLMQHRDVIDIWIDESERGVRPRAADLRQRRELVAAVLRVRAAMFRYEPIVARLDRMAPYVADSAATVEITPGTSAADLYRTVANDRRVMAERRAEVRRVLKLYADRNGGETPFEPLEALEDRLRDE